MVVATDPSGSYYTLERCVGAADRASIGKTTTEPINATKHAGVNSLSVLAHWHSSRARSRLASAREHTKQTILDLLASLLRPLRLSFSLSLSFSRSFEIGEDRPNVFFDHDMRSSFLFSPCSAPCSRLFKRAGLQRHWGSAPLTPLPPCVAPPAPTQHTQQPGGVRPRMLGRNLFPIRRRKQRDQHQHPGQS